MSNRKLTQLADDVARASDPLEALEKSRELVKAAAQRAHSPSALRHMGLPVRDIERSRTFYGDILGLTEVARPHFYDFKGAWFTLPSGQQLHLFENPDGTYRRPDRGVDVRDTHFALQVGDFMGVCQRLRARGHALTVVPETYATRYEHAYITDPDNHVIEIVGGETNFILAE